jgi:uncharacterized protein YggU (UPF0235/DUF167 family)
MPGSCTIAIRLKPNAKREKVEADGSGGLAVWVNAPPIEGRANTALLSLLSETLDIPKSCLSIKRGLGSKNKVVEIAGITKEELSKRVCSGVR